MDKSEILALRRAVLEKDFARMNDRQKQAVFTVNGPLLILAGAGSGKTTVLINRIANILRYGDAYNSTYLRDDLDENDIAACKAYIENGHAAHNGIAGAFECFCLRAVAHHGYYLYK